jgi:uncharacterized membrane-anchored protein YhcB (DUF1043 family)
MNVMFLMLLIVAVAISACYACYRLGCRKSNNPDEIDRLNAEIDRLNVEQASVQERVEQVKTGVNGHFEQSAVLFGALAKDYRAFLDHFSQSARDLGLSEGQSENLLEQATRPLLASPPSTRHPEMELESTGQTHEDESTPETTAEIHPGESKEETAVCASADESAPDGSRPIAAVPETEQLNAREVSEADPKT